MNKPLIQVCIATYHREEWLSELISALTQQETAAEFDVGIIVADNSETASARGVIEHWREQTELELIYVHQPKKNISLTRNAACQASTGDLVAFIDDDEVPPLNWLLTLCRALQQFDADGVHGPIEPNYAIEPPQWIVKGGFFAPAGHATGFQGDYVAATNNCLLKAECLGPERAPFSEAFGLTGGEDSYYFYHLRQQGRKLVWCREAMVMEHIPASRLNRQWLTQRLKRQGNTYVRIRLATGQRSAFVFYLLKACLKLMLVGGLMPFALLAYGVRPQWYYSLWHRGMQTLGELSCLRGQLHQEYA